MDFETRALLLGIGAGLWLAGSVAHGSLGKYTGSAYSAMIVGISMVGCAVLL